jgi:hypothetical protein
MTERAHGEPLSEAELRRRYPLNEEANRRHLEALIGIPPEFITRAPAILDVPWFKLPKSFRGTWWRATGYGQHPPAPEFTAQLPQLIAAVKAEIENSKREIATAREVERSRQAQARRPCESCLRPTPCQERCLRLMTVVA